MNISTKMKKVFALCERHAYFKSVYNDSKLESLKLGSAGVLLSDNIYREWLYITATSRTENILPTIIEQKDKEKYLSNFRDSFQYVKTLFNGQLPFGLAEVCRHAVTEENTTKEIMTPLLHTDLRCSLFVAASQARQNFYALQHHRKLWWSRFSVSPGRFSLSGVEEVPPGTESSQTTQSVDIIAEFEWGPSVVETIKLLPLPDVLSAPESDIKTRDGRKVVVPNVLENVISLEGASMAFLCDSFSETSESRQLLRLHRRLAPYKVCFAAPLASAAQGEKMRNLAQHILKQIGGLGLTGLLLPDLGRKSLDFQINRHDEMGIPFTIILSDSTLEDGIARLYSRETTLKEQIHITDLPKYLERLVLTF